MRDSAGTTRRDLRRRDTIDGRCFMWVHLSDEDALALERRRGRRRTTAGVRVHQTRSIGVNDEELSRPPSVLGAIEEDTRALGFTMASEPKTGALLAALAASKPGGRLLELGTGTGVGTAWLLSGMDGGARLDTVDVDRTTQAVAQRHLGTDARVSFHAEEGAAFLARAAAAAYDLVYADAWPGKFTHLPETLALLRPGGIYIIDDLLAHPAWPGDHPAKVSALIALLEAQPGCRTVRLSWASGLMLLVRAGLP